MSIQKSYAPNLGPLRPIIPEVVGKFLDCGNLERGFARVRCDECQHEYLLAFSCKSRWFCPSCHQRKVQTTAEFITQHVLAPVPHRHFVLAIPKMLRPYFQRHRGLLKNLCALARDSLTEYLRTALDLPKGIPGMIMTIHTFGEYLNFLAAITQHIPEKGIQMVRYYGWYSNKMRGCRQPDPAPETARPPSRPHIIPPPPRRLPSKKWCDIIRQVWHTDPLICPKCQRPMRVVAVIDQREVVEKILRHLGLWSGTPLLAPARAPPDADNGLWTREPCDDVDHHARLRKRPHRLESQRQFEGHFPWNPLSVVRRWLVPQA